MGLLVIFDILTKRIGGALLRAQDLFRPELGPPPLLSLLSVKMLMRKKIFLCHKNKDHTRVSGPRGRVIAVFPGVTRIPLKISARHKVPEVRHGPGVAPDGHRSGMTVAGDRPRTTMESIKHPRRRENRKPVGVARMVAAGAHATARVIEVVDTSVGDREAARANALRRRNEDRDQAHDRVEVCRRSTSASANTRSIILVGGMKQA